MSGFHDRRESYFNYCTYTPHYRLIIQVFNFLTGLSTTGLLINYAVICATYIRFRKACLVQGIKRVEAAVSPLQPVLAWYGLCWSVFLSIPFQSTVLI